MTDPVQNALAAVEAWYAAGGPLIQTLAQSIAAPPVISDPNAPPAQASAAGFTNMDFFESFADITKSIDLGNTGNQGFAFYIANAFDSGHTNPSTFSQISGGGVRCTSGEYNAAAQTWSRTGTIFGVIFGYTEYQAAIVNPGSGNSPGWASVWSLSQKHLTENNLDQYTERDTMEWFGYPAFTIHDWGKQTASGGHVQSNNNVSVPAGFDPTKRNKFGELHEDLGNGHGRISLWINDKFMKGITYGPNIIPSYCDAAGKNIGNVGGGAVAGTFRINYTDPVCLMFGTGSNMPMDLYSVRHFGK